jgi:hypothetical protein
MGKSDGSLIPIYQDIVKTFNSPIAYLGFRSVPNWGPQDGDAYDIATNGWDINSDWTLKKKYKSVICTRCAYFCNNPANFIRKCHESLDDNGKLFVDWGLGDHWRFPTYKVGWIKDEEHEYAYSNNNYLWSCLWHNNFSHSMEVQRFSSWIKTYGYEDLNQAILDEVPSILTMQTLNKYFDTNISFLAMWPSCPQLYIFAVGDKKYVK